MIEKRNTAHKKNVKTVRDRNTGADIAEAGTWADPGHDDDEEGKSEEGEPEHEEGEGEGEGGKNKIAKTEIVSQFLLPTEAVKRITSKENTTVNTDMCQVGGHTDCNKSIRIPNGGTQGVLQHFFEWHQALNGKIRALPLKTLPVAYKKTRGIL